VRIRVDDCFVFVQPCVPSVPPLKAAKKSKKRAKKERVNHRKRPLARLTTGFVNYIDLWYHLPPTPTEYIFEYERGKGKPAVFLFCFHTKAKFTFPHDDSRYPPLNPPPAVVDIFNQKFFFSTS
jgi:hypothetical protein